MQTVHLHNVSSVSFCKTGVGENMHCGWHRQGKNALWIQKDGDETNPFVYQIHQKNVVEKCKGRQNWANFSISGSAASYAGSATASGGMLVCSQEVDYTHILVSKMISLRLSLLNSWISVYKWKSDPRDFTSISKFFCVFCNECRHRFP